MNFSVAKPLNDLIIRYTLDGAAPTKNSMELKNGLLIDQSKNIRLAAFTKNGRRGDVYDLNFINQDFSQAENISSLKNGLFCKWYKRSFDSTIHITGERNDVFTTSGVIVPERAKAESFSLQYDGYINVPAEGIYTFYLTSDDASVLKIAGKEVVNNDGMHAPKERNGQVALERGLHKFALDFIEGGGGYTLKLQYSINNSEPQDIPDDWFKKNSE
jgi:hexosaminidase